MDISMTPLACRRLWIETLIEEIQGAVWVKNDATSQIHYLDLLELD